MNSLHNIYSANHLFRGSDPFPGEKSHHPIVRETGVGLNWGESARKPLHGQDLVDLLQQDIHAIARQG